MSTFVAALLVACLAATAAYKHRWDPPLRAASGYLARRSLVSRLPSTAPPLRVALLFRPGDCGERLAVVDSLNRLQERNVAGVFGLLAADARRVPGWHDIVRADDIRFAVRLISPEAVAAIPELRRLRTPATIVIDPDGGIRPIELSTLFHEPTVR